MPTITTRHSRKGFSLVEMLIALLVVLGISGVTFQLFVQNQRLFRDQQVILEMHQSARAVAALIADDIHRAGQSVPVFAASMEPVASEAVQVFLSGTDGTRIRLRGPDDNAETALTDPLPLVFETGRQLTVRPRSSAFRPATASHIYLWGRSDESWTWVRARVDALIGGGGLQITPTSLSSEGGRMTSAPQVGGEDAVSYRLSGRSILRGELRGFTSAGDPLFRELSVGDDFTSLEFRYYDDSGQLVESLDPEARNTIQRVDLGLEAETSERLSDGSFRRYAVVMSVSPRNLEMR